MKKLYTLILMLGMFLIPQITTYGYTINDLDTPIAELNDLTLREVFEDGNQIPNLTWVFNDTIYENNQFIIAPNDSLGFFINNQNQIGNNINDLFYLSYNVISVTASSLATGQISASDLFPSTTITKNIGFNSHLDNAEVANGRLSFSINNNSITISDDIQLINLTALGIDLTKEQMDYWFQEYQNILIFIEGYNAGILASEAYAQGFDTGYDTGYGDGYQDAVEEDNAYAIGYALGIQEGQDMETGSSIIVLVLGLMAFVMMLFGFTSRRRIFNLFASGLFIVLGGILVEYAAFVIVAVGLVIVNVYYTFVSE